ncbi:MAG: hypothetical protein ABWW65_02720 [Thermoprotei archaeon]
MDIIRKVIMYISSFDIAMAILPYKALYGLVDKVDEYATSKHGSTCSLYISRNSWYYKSLLALAKNYGVPILLPGVYERAGSRKYFSAILFNSGQEPDSISHRKLVLNRESNDDGINRGSELTVFRKDNIDLSFAVLLDEEHEYLELSRMYSFLSDFIVSAFSPDKYGAYRELSRIISIICKCKVIVPGAIYYIKKKLYVSTPTLIFENGRLLYKYSRDKQAVIMIPRDKLKQENVFNNFEQYRRIVTMIYKQFLRRGVSIGNRQSYSHQNV